MCHGRDDEGRPHGTASRIRDGHDRAGRQAGALERRIHRCVPGRSAQPRLLRNRDGAGSLADPARSGPATWLHSLARCLGFRRVRLDRGADATHGEPALHRQAGREYAGRPEERPHQLGRSEREAAARCGAVRCECQGRCRIGRSGRGESNIVETAYGAAVVRRDSRRRTGGVVSGVQVHSVHFAVHAGRQPVRCRGHCNTNTVGTQSPTGWEREHH